jgi:hypothetical protein
MVTAVVDRREVTFPVYTRARPTAPPGWAPARFVAGDQHRFTLAVWATHVACRVDTVPAYTHWAWGRLMAGEPGWRLVSMAARPVHGRRLEVKAVFECPAGAGRPDPDRTLVVEVRPGDEVALVVWDPDDGTPLEVSAGEFFRRARRRSVHPGTSDLDRLWAELIARRAFRGRCGRVRLSCLPVGRLPANRRSAQWRWVDLFERLAEELKPVGASLSIHLPEAVGV